MRVVWDLLIVAILAFCAWRGYRKGLIKTLFGLAGVLLAFVGAISLKGVVGGYIDQAFVHKPVENFVISTIAGSKVGSYETALENVDVAKEIEQMPSALRELLAVADIDPQEIIDRATKQGNSAKKELVACIADPISATISTAIAFIVLFILLSILCVVAAKFLSAVCNLLPLGKQINQIGGILAGVLKGAVVVFVLCTIVGVLSATTDRKSDGPISQKTIQSTMIFKEIVQLTPAKDLMK